MNMQKKLPRWAMWLFISLVMAAAISFIYLDEWLIQYLSPLGVFNNAIIAAALHYFRYIGTDHAFSFLYVFLIIAVLYQWHVHRRIAYRPLFIIISLSVTVTIIYCLATFFSQYVPQLAILAGRKHILLLNDPSRAFPSAHIARLVCLATCLCVLFPRKALVVSLVACITTLLVGVSLLFNNRYFLSGLCLGVMVGILVPHYVKSLIFVKRVFHTSQSIRG